MKQVEEVHLETETATREYSQSPLEAPRRVTLRAFVIGLLLSGVLASVCVWFETAGNVHFLGGVQMPFGAVFGLMLAILLNWPLRVLAKRARFIKPFSPTELLTMYAMLMFSALSSTPGADNFFLSTGPTLFYYSTAENGWASLFYKYVPKNFAPGWDGSTYQKSVIEPFYTGAMNWRDIPWQAWIPMLIAWGIFLSLIYSTLFFLSLLLRRQWIESEALAFPLVQLPLQMVETDAESSHPPANVFWGNRLMWWGFIFALVIHFFRGMPTYFPDWPVINAFQGNGVTLLFTERPWSAIGSLSVTFFLAGIGIAYLLTREVSFSFWVFFLLMNYSKVLAEQLGYAVSVLPKDSYMGRPMFLTYQSFGGWLMMGAMLLWSARRQLGYLFKQAVGRNETQEGEPFSPRTVVIGLLLSVAGLFAWSMFAGINILSTVVFFALYMLLSIVLARVVIEGGFLFPQITFSPLEMMTTGLMGSGAIGASSLTKLSFVQPTLMSDMRTNLLPAFLHTLKMGHSLKLERAQLRRLMLCAAAAVFLTLLVTIVASIVTVYRYGGLTGYTWFTYAGPQQVFTSTASVLKQQPGIDGMNLFWLAIGALVVLGLTIMRARFAWFPLHPLGYIVASGYPITQLWPSFFLGWLIKSLLMRFGGSDAVTRFRPFMIGLILGNIVAIVLWLIYGAFLGKGTYIPYWTA